MRFGELLTHPVSRIVTATGGIGLTVWMIASTNNPTRAGLSPVMLGARFAAACSVAALVVAALCRVAAPRRPPSLSLLVLGTGAFLGVGEYVYVVSLDDWRASKWLGVALVAGAVFALPTLAGVHHLLRWLFWGTSGRADAS